MTNWFFFHINENNFYFFTDFKHRDLSIIIREKFNQRRHNFKENVKRNFSKEFFKFIKGIFI